MIRSNIIEKASHFPIDILYWDHPNLTPEENRLRNYAAPWLSKTLEFLEEIENPIIVEIGSTRYETTQECIYYFDNCFSLKTSKCNECQDGHSAFFWARPGYEVYTVDIDSRCKKMIEDQYKYHIKTPIPENLHIHIPQDGIEFLENFDKQISLLYLDGWNVGDTLYAEKHLEAFKVAESKLAPLHIVSIDDSDFVHDEGGKNKLLGPYLEGKGYVKLLEGRQVVYLSPA